MLSTVGSVRDLECRLRTKDGPIVTIHLSAELLEVGGEPCMLSTLVDVTERRRAAEALRREKTFADKLLNAPRNTVFLFEPATGQPIRWNERFAEVSGYRDAEIAALKVPDDFCDGDDLQKAREGMAQVLAEGQGMVELSLVTKQGQRIPFEYAVTVVETEEGKTLFLSIGRDITERKQAEEALRQSEEKHKGLIETTDTGYVILDAQGRVIDANQEYARLTGRGSIEDVVGHSVLEWTFPSDVERNAAEVRECAERGFVRNLEVDYLTPTGQLIPVEINATVLHAEGGIQILSLVRDITERKRTEAALRELNTALESKVAQRTAQLQQRARQLQKLTLELTEAEERERKRLAEILHDDLQQVLAAAKFQVGLLNSRLQDDAEAQELAAHARNLLVDAIAKSRSLSHQLRPPVLSQSDLGEVFEWLAQEMQTKHGLTVHLEIGARMELASEALRVLLYKAAQEALFNVIKHAGVREATLRLRRQCGRLRLSVADRGRGFDPTAPACTLGFGLLSVRERVELLGGRLKIRSAPGQGSVFLLSVPDAQADERGKTA